MASERGARDRAVAAFVTKHREELEAYAGSERENAERAAALLAWEREDACRQEEQK